MFEEVKQLYIDYKYWVNDFQGSGGAGQRLMRLFSHNKEFNAQPQHQTFYHGVEEAAGRILEDVKQNGGDVYELVHYAFIDCYSGTRRASSFMFLAAEQIFIPFLDHLTQEELVELEADYKKQRRKDPGLPIQTKIKKRIKQLIQ